MASTMPGTVPTPSAPYPTLVALDRARGSEAMPFASDPNATELERHARTLTNEFWSETTWLTGMVNASLLDVVCDRLEAEREALHHAIRLFETTDTSIGERIERA